MRNVEWKYWRESRRRWRLDYRFFRFSSCQEFLSSFSSKKLKNELHNLKWQLSQKNWFFVAWPQKVFFVVGQTFKLREDQYNWCMMPKSGYNFKYRSITDYSNPRRVISWCIITEHWFCFFLQVMLLNQTRPHRASWR